MIIGGDVSIFAVFCSPGGSFCCVPSPHGGDQPLTEKSARTERTRGRGGF